MFLTLTLKWHVGTMHLSTVYYQYWQSTLYKAGHRLTYINYIILICGQISEMWVKFLSVSGI